MQSKDLVLKDLAQRMSLRAPQKTSLERLAEAVEAAGLKKGATTDELEAQLAAVRALGHEDVELPAAAAFDWPFLSFAFALATGVGKTRLMGAVIAYLYRVKGLRNFVVIAPGKTIYEKLISDFTEGTPKYVFKGLAAFATQKPIIVTGDTYQNGAALQQGDDLLGYSIVVNVFNIQKLNERGETHEDAQKDVARIRRVSETLGMSYFDYLKSREDLVVLMDEAHHYRAGEAAKTVSEMKPVLGIEMTATPRIGKRAFSDVLFRYGLADAMQDGFVKEPAVVRRQNFREGDYAGREDELDHLKLQDAMIVHESTKAALTEYAFKNGVQPVKPFVLVVAPDQKYADQIEAYIQSAAFCGGQYAKRVIKVYSKKGANNDEAIAQLLDIERPGNKIEIVIHVNMLSEGWDVTNLYTIVPLRAANSETLVEQTIGRGLRLPYGRRTGVDEIDTLSIVSHDKFDAIISAARNLQIEMKAKDVPAKSKTSVVAKPVIVLPLSPVDASETPLDNGTAAAVAKIQELVGGEEPNVQGVDVNADEIKVGLRKAVAETLGKDGANPSDEDVETCVARALALVDGSFIEIPRITISPGNTTMRITDFELNEDALNYALRDDRLVYDYVRTRKVRDVKVQQGAGEDWADELKKYARDLASRIAAFDDIDYDACGELAGRLVDTCVSYLNARLEPSELANCMRNNVRSLAAGIRAQMLEHAVYDSDEDRVTVQPGEFRLKANALSVDADETPRPFDMAVADGEKSRIRSMVFTGFKKCLFTLQKFDSDPERAFSEMLEREAEVRKWFKPTLSNLRLWYGPNEYTPDFVFETDADKFLCEVKAVGKVEDAIVQAKKNAAVKWCHYASDAAVQSGGKPWHYLLVPDNAINSSLELKACIAEYGC